MSTPVFPGGASVSHLRVYDWPADDAPLGSGTPHLHTTSTEAYVTLAGRGRVETLGPEGFAVHELVPGRIVWFTPGVIHRAVNDGDLEVLVVMSNAGLPEAGDAVMTFPADVLDSPERYAEAARLPSPADVGDAEAARAARARRDLALEGYAVLRAAVGRHGPGALEPLHDAAARLVAPRVAGWRRTWEASAAAATEQTAAALAALARGSAATLADGRVASIDAAPGTRRYGMCGRLQTWPLTP
ncbi:cupin domain-containing protein [Isoptericola variabilis]|uniref:Cupin 2 conserved barrel domain protein n=1 Tax=Isoptericola variabilis (strain 225) TaxID=743718 RepID=F6FU77_ISOV2|nr:cupin domain-containing protein [Isoptericola variabilis]AEG43273.1 Cupin 2 conserved barrel domain protein [Isoptericola variabilis 225]TWH35208.1 Cupin domain-containing protein [Isoptericola variabilis J7]